MKKYKITLYYGFTYVKIMFMKKDLKSMKKNESS